MCNTFKIKKTHFLSLAYVPRRERNALTSSDSKSSLGSSEIRRSASLRTARIQPDDQDETDSKRDSKGIYVVCFILDYKFIQQLSF